MTKFDYGASRMDYTGLPCPPDMQARAAADTAALDRELLAFVARHQPCSFAMLARTQVALGESISVSQRQVFYKRLARLIKAAALRCEGSQKARKWMLPGFDWQAHVDDIRDVPLLSQAIARQPQLVPPREVDVMRGPVYSPGSGPVLRLGANVFLSIKSRGYGC